MFISIDIYNKCKIVLFVNYLILYYYYGVYILGFKKINNFYDIKFLLLNKFSLSLYINIMFNFLYRYSRGMFVLCV